MSENKKLICGVGVSEKGLYDRTYVDTSGRKRNSKEYALWLNMLTRCYREDSLTHRPLYTNCTVSENFKNFQWFANWCQRQVGYNQDGWHLDKDILFKGNKIYSEFTCVFLPTQLNTLLISCSATRGKFPIGVSYHKATKKFSATISTLCMQHHLGLFQTVEGAFQAYKKAKESFIKEQAESWKDQIDPRAYEALLNYTVEITD